MAAALHTAKQIVDAVEVPVSVDFEGGYAVSPADVKANVAALIATGAIGLNFEDRIVGGEGLHDIEVQKERIAAIKEAANDAGVPIFINARTDVFFSGSKAPVETLLTEALARASAYAEAGADGVFVPGINDLKIIAQISDQQSLPLNVMRMGAGPEISDLANAGVSRVSHGPGPYTATMTALTASAVV